MVAKHQKNVDNFLKHPLADIIISSKVLANITITAIALVYIIISTTVLADIIILTKLLVDIIISARGCRKLTKLNNYNDLFSRKATFRTGCNFF